MNPQAILTQNKTGNSTIFHTLKKKPKKRKEINSH